MFKYMPLPGIKLTKREKKVLLAWTDLAALRLADQHHVWTADERRYYERAVRTLKPAER